MQTVALQSKQIIAIKTSFTQLELRNVFQI